MCCGVSLIGDERRCQVVHRLPRKHDTTRVHFRMPWKAIEKSGCLNRRFIWFFRERHVAELRAAAQKLDESRRLKSCWFIRIAETPREMFGEPPHLMFGQAENFRHVSKGAS